MNIPSAKAAATAKIYPCMAAPANKQNATAATASKTPETRRFPAGSFIIRMDQPYSRIADALERLTTRESKVSAHYVVFEDGRIVQCVPEPLRAWHAGQSFYRGRSHCNDDSIGIELEGLEGLPFDAAQYETLARLCLDIVQRYPIKHIAGHEHIAPARKADPGAGFDWSRLQTLLCWPEHFFPASPSPTSP